MSQSSLTDNHFGLRLVSLSGARYESSLEEAYNSAYVLWKSQWSAVLRQTSGLEKLFADNFTRQDEVMALFSSSQCIAVCCHRVVDMNCQAYCDDSYFAEWPKSAIDRLGRDYKGPMVIASQLAIHPDYRRSTSGALISQVMVFLTLKKMMRVRSSGVIVSARSLRGMSALCETCNPLKIADIEMNGEPSALYVYEPEAISFLKMNPVAVDLGEYLLEKEEVSSFVNSFFKPLRKGENNVFAA